MCSGPAKRSFDTRLVVPVEFQALVRRNTACLPNDDVSALSQDHDQRDRRAMLHSNVRNSVLRR